MSVGIIILGILIGTGAGIAGLIMGLSVWMALLIYAGIGSLSVFVWIVVLLLSPKKLPSRAIAGGRGA